MAALDAGTVQNINALAGVVIGVLAAAVAFLFRALVKALQDVGTEKDKRLADSIAARQQYEEVMKGFSQTTELLYNKLKGR